MSKTTCKKASELVPGDVIRVRYVERTASIMPVNGDGWKFKVRETFTLADTGKLYATDDRDGRCYGISNPDVIFESW